MREGAVTIRLLKGAPPEMRDLQRVLDEAPTYAHRLTGVAPGHADAQSTYTALPDGKSYDDKFVFGLYLGRQMVGCADLIRGYPKITTALIGLLLLSERHQRRGVGRRAYALLEEFIQSWGTCDHVRIGVVRTNEDVMPFWSRLGFDPTGELKPYRYGSIQSEIIVLQKRLPDSSLERAADGGC
jgi:GNAT superfamily N-acetyltransferase